MTDASLFRIYSMTKPVTSVAAMILWEEGRFDLDDPVSRFLPEFADVMVLESESGPLRPPAGPITVRDLMLHTSGLSHRTSSLYRDAEVRRRDIPMSQFIENITSVPLLEDPGTRYRYSEGTTVLGALVEIWSGRPFDEFLEERVFGPLGMESTAFWVRPEDRGRLTTAYAGGRGEPQRPVEIEEVPFTVRPELLEGAVGLVSTVPDFLSFSQMLMNRGELGGVRILEPETVDLLTANGLPPEVLAARQGTMGWGLGNVNVVMDPASLSYPAGMGEYGWDGSAGTIFWNDPASDLVIVLMWQNQPANPGSLRQRLKTLVYEAILD
jgi:CubicO group peptidase (beta-lactamase class C family)